VIEVQECRLGALEQNPLTTGQGVVNDGDGVTNHWSDAGSEFSEVEIENVVHFERESVVHLGEHGVLLPQDDVKFLAKDRGVEQVLDA